jgi:hypothetical protein
MDARFARTKIQPPRPRAGSLVARPALESRLTGALLTHRMVLLCAAAGYGKTTALTREIACLPAGTALASVVGSLQVLAPMLHALRGERDAALAAALDKLGASTRGQAAAWWRDHARAA